MQLERAASVQQSQYVRAGNQMAKTTSVVSNGVGLANSAVGEEISRVQLQARRKEAFRKLNKVVAQYEN
jgi:hypothetical protein